MRFIHLEKVILSSILVFIGTLMTFAQMHGGSTNGDSSKMQGHCPMCGRQWDGRNYYTPTIPDSLPVPRKKIWIQQLNGVMLKERFSKAQYQKDEQKYSLHMPYTMIIPQEENHIEWISGLYKAFKMQPPDSVPPTKKTNSAQDALQTGMQLEEKLITDYELLIKNAENDTVKQILEDILYQTRMHFTMFQHALHMGNMMR